MPAPFPHSCTITRSTFTGSEAAGEGPSTIRVYPGAGEDGRCNFTESAQAVRREMGGDVDPAGKGVLTLSKAPSFLADSENDEVDVTANGRTYSGCGILGVSYNRRRIVLVLDLEKRPALA